MTNKFQPYDVVEVISNKPFLRKIYGKKGIIRGISQSEEAPSIFAYAVDIPALKINCFIFEEELKATGRKANPEQVQSSTFISIDKNGDMIE